MEIVKIENKTFLKEKLIDFAENCSWEAGKHLAFILKENNFLEWEAVFAAVEDGEIIGFCTFLETDYYPENRYSPWISSIFVDEKFRGNKISFRLIENTIEYENGKDYLIDIQWFGGGVKLWSTYQNGQFIFITEEKSW